MSSRAWWQTFRRHHCRGRGSLLPNALATPRGVSIRVGERTASRSSFDDASLKDWFPRTYGKPILEIQSGGASTKTSRVAICFNGRQAPGANNVVIGLFDHLKAASPSIEVLGVLGGSRGLFDGSVRLLTHEYLAPFRNAGGMVLGRSVDKIRSPADQAAALAAATELDLDGLVLVGGTFTNSDAAHLAEYFEARGSKCAIVGAPVTIDGDVRNSFVEATLGFATATRVLSSLVGAMATDCASSKKYWYVMRVMGRTGDHIAAEVALQTHPNFVVLGQDIEAQKLTLNDLIREIADVVAARAEQGKNYGVIVCPEGWVMAVPELRGLIAEMNILFREGADPEDVPSRLSPWAAAVLAYLPPLVHKQLLLERESSGSVQLSQISSEKLLVELVGAELARRKRDGRYKGKWAYLNHFFGYQARSAFPCNFDCSYGLALGATAAALILGGCNGYMATIRGLAAPVPEWQPCGVPLTAMMSVPAPGTPLAAAFSPSDSGAATSSASSNGAGAAASAHRSGARPVINSAPFDVRGPVAAALRSHAGAWATGDHYSNPGPVQFSGPSSEDVPITLTSSVHDCMSRIGQLRSQLDALASLCRPGVSDDLLDSAIVGVSSLARILGTMAARE